MSLNLLSDSYGPQQTCACLQGACLETKRFRFISFTEVTVLLCKVPVYCYSLFRFFVCPKNRKNWHARKQNFEPTHIPQVRMYRDMPFRLHPLIYLLFNCTNILWHINALPCNRFVNKFPRREILGKQSVARLRNNRGMSRVVCMSRDNILTTTNTGCRFYATVCKGNGFLFRPRQATHITLGRLLPGIKSVNMQL
jgi:hypothetical protein